MFGPSFSAAGIPDAFQSAYRCLTGLQAQLEGLLASPQQRRYMRAHPASQDFARRFNLPIYFQLRVQELTKALDAALLPRGTPLPAAAPEPEPEPEPGPGQGRALGADLLPLVVAR